MSCEEEFTLPLAGAADVAAKVSGPASATDNAVARYDATTGKLIQDSLVTIGDTGNVSLPALATVDGRDVSVDGAALDAIPATVTAKANRRLVVNSQSGTTYTLVQGDEDTGVETTNGSAVTVTVPSLAAGTVIQVFQLGAGQVAFTGSGVTLRIPDGGKIAAQYKAATLFWRSTTEVLVMGQVTT